MSRPIIVSMNSFFINLRTYNCQLSGVNKPQNPDGEQFWERIGCNGSAKFSLFCLWQDASDGSADGKMDQPLFTEQDLSILRNPTLNVKAIRFLAPTLRVGFPNLCRVIPTLKSYANVGAIHQSPLLHSANLVF